MNAAQASPPAAAHAEEVNRDIDAWMTIIESHVDDICDAAIPFAALLPADGNLDRAAEEFRRTITAQHFERLRAAIAAIAKRSP